MIYLYMYLCIGLGFSLASWLEAESIAAKEKIKPFQMFNVKKILIFSFAWWLVAIYYYRAYVTKTIPTIEVMLAGRK